jgi:pyruvate formate lyase activating enzyme
MSGEELLQELEKDRVFYEASGGGVTFSGGECLDQLDFLEKVLKNCQENHLHTAIDTTGDADYFILDKLFLLSNLILYDFKCFSDDLHTQGTGVSNCRILENLSRLLENYPEKIWIRIPVIPLFNTCDREMKKMAEFLASRNRPARIELLPYHRLGEAKCIALGFADTIFPNPPSEEEMKKFRAMFDLPIESMVFS